MTTFIERFMKRLPIIIFVGAMLALFIYGSGPTAGQTPAATPAASLPSARPTISAEAKGSTVAGVQGSYCWPQAGAEAECDVVDEPEVTTPISVADGDTLAFKIDPASPAPAEFRVILPNDTDANGDPRQFDLIPANGVFTVKDLTAGPHRVNVEAVYTGQGGSQPFVTFAFVLQVGTGIATAPAGTPAATESATAASTPEATQAVEASPSAATAEVVTATTDTTATTPATAEVTVEVTVVASTEAPTIIAPTAEIALATPTATATTPAAVETAVEATPTGTTSAEPVSVPTETPTEMATVIRPTSTPQSPTIEPLPTEVPSVEPPTPTVAIEPTSIPLPTEASRPPDTATPSITSTPGLASIAPPMQVTVAGRTYQPIAYSACVLGLGGEQTCINRPNNAPDERISAAPGTVAQLNFQGPRPSSITVLISNADSTRILNRQTLPADNLALYALPTTPGSYILATEFVWPTGKSTYYFRLTIGS